MTKPTGHGSLPRNYPSRRRDRDYRREPGFIGPAKDLCREALVARGQEVLGRPPRRVFTLAGRDAECVRLFRRTWGDDFPIISIDHQAVVARLSPTDEIAYDAYYLAAGVRGYLLHDTPMIPREPLRVKFDPVAGYAFDKFDLAFLDFTAFPNRVHLEMAAEFLTLEMARPSVLGCTFDLEAHPHGTRQKVSDDLKALTGHPEISPDNVRAAFTVLLGRQAEVADLISYETTCKMVFLTAVRRA
jgi:hypothetical protein